MARRAATSPRLIALLLLVAGAAAAEQPPGQAFPANRTCSAIDPTYVSLAEETGGLLLPLSPQTLTTHAKEIGALLAARLASVDLVRGELAAGHRRIEAPVEAGVQRLMVSVCVDEEREIALLDPEGVAFGENDPAGLVLREGRHRIFVVGEPKPGPWAVRISGSGRYLAWVKVEGGVTVDENRPDGVLDTPVVGSEQEWVLGVSGKPKDVRLALVDADGARIADAPLAIRNGHFAARLATPPKPFRLQVAGTDRFGQRFRRTLPRLVRPVSGDDSAIPADRARVSDRRSRTP